MWLDTLYEFRFSLIPHLLNVAKNETRRRIEEEAEAEDISVSAWIGRAIEKYFELENNSGKEQVL